MGKLPHDAVIHPRSDANDPIRAEDEEQVSTGFLKAGMLRLRESLGELARQVENRGNPVDEYNTAATSGAATESTVTVLPTYEYMPEKIESIIVVGPPGNITLNLGDRSWPLTIPASGVIVIAPVAVLLGRNDTRQLVSATPGTYFIELMGIGDRRFSV